MPQHTLPQGTVVQPDSVSRFCAHWFHSLDLPRTGSSAGTRDVRLRGRASLSASQPPDAREGRSLPPLSHSGSCLSTLRLAAACPSRRRTVRIPPFEGPARCGTPWGASSGGSPPHRLPRAPRSSDRTRNSARPCSAPRRPRPRTLGRGLGVGGNSGLAAHLGRAGERLRDRAAQLLSHHARVLVGNEPQRKLAHPAAGRQPSR